ncbi:MAG: tetratricopeptide repeat protein [Acidimicrobiales bacterium]
MVDVTDATFQTDVIEASHSVAVVVDLWAPWCGPCRTLGPILEKVIDETKGQVVLAKVNVDENPGISQAFQVQSIPAVYAIKDGRPVGEFLGSKSEAWVRSFVEQLLPTGVESEIGDLLTAGDEPSLRKILDIDPGHAVAIVKLGEILVHSDRGDEALALLERIPETADTRRIAALARGGVALVSDVESKFDALLPRVKADEEARQEYLDILELLGPDDPRTATYRRRLTSALF